jgi:hypothetical protein
MSVPLIAFKAQAAASLGNIGLLDLPISGPGNGAIFFGEKTLSDGRPALAFR